jgi:2-polyprenyl-3-methyl-5-hydroxy-6-metoxy-1,4-benzoquinol methylase
MQYELLDRLRCPVCKSGQFQAEATHEMEVRYAAALVREVVEGHVVCTGCAATFPIEQYVLSFAGLLEPAVRDDGAYWGSYYRRLYDYGVTGFLDTQSPPAPFLGSGILKTLPFDGSEWQGPHSELAEHPWIKPGGRVVDVGVGSGWSSLFLARRGFQVIGFDPALELMQLAKQYAMEQGVALEYVCADMASFHMQPASVDAVFALHSLHHVPDLYAGLAQIHTMLCEGGCLALDDHYQDPPLLALLRHGILLEAEDYIFPAYRDPAVRPEPPESHSANEGVGMGQLLPAIEKYLHIDEIAYRHIALDFVGPLYYLQQQCDPAALHAATAITDLIKRGMQRVWPEQVEYVTLVAQKRATLPGHPRFAPGPRDPMIELPERLATQERELARLHAAVAAKDQHIRHLEALLARIENGLLMRLLRRFNRS